MQSHKGLAHEFQTTCWLVTGGCKINAHLVWRTRDVCSGGQEICFWRSKFGAAPPTPRGYNAEGDRVDLLLQNKRSHLPGAPDTAPLSFVQRGAGGGGET